MNPLPREAYAHRGSSDIKTTVNHSFVQRVLTLPTPPSALQCLYLESHELHTTQHLRDIGVPDSGLVIVNKDKEVHRLLRDRLPLSIRVVPGTVHSFLQTAQTKFDAVFLDYCATFERVPLQDVTLAFERSLFADHCVLAVTGSGSRKRAGCNEYTKESAVFNIELHRIAMAHGYYVCPHEEADYGKARLVLYVYTLTRLCPAAVAAALSAWRRDPCIYMHEAGRKRAAGPPITAPKSDVVNLPEPEPAVEATLATIEQLQQTDKDYYYYIRPAQLQQHPKLLAGVLYSPTSMLCNGQTVLIACHVNSGSNPKERETVWFYPAKLSEYVAESHSAKLTYPKPEGMMGCWQKTRALKAENYWSGTGDIVPEQTWTLTQVQCNAFFKNRVLGRSHVGLRVALKTEQGWCRGEVQEQERNRGREEIYRIAVASSTEAAAVVVERTLADAGFNGALHAPLGAWCLA